jgi:hypothetical protein
MPDFKFINAGSLYLLAPQTQAARRHLQRHTGPENQWWGGNLVVEPRYVRGLVEQLRDEGWSI